LVKIVIDGAIVGEGVLVKVENRKKPIFKVLDIGIRYIQV